jgi:hypothetical protein
LKTKIFLTKEPMKKIKNKKNKEQNEKKIWEIVIEGLNWKQIRIL